MLCRTLSPLLCATALFGCVPEDSVREADTAGDAQAPGDGGDNSAGDADADSPTPDSDATPPAVEDAATSSALPVRPPESCEGMFGSPIETTGLTLEQCSPRCDCEDGLFEPPVYSESDLSDFESWTLLNPPDEITEDPYATPEAHPHQPDKVCAMVPESITDKTYRLQTYDSDGAASADGAWLTHTGACGACSTLADLGVYIRQGDLTTPVRACGVEHLAGLRPESHIECLTDLGFSRPCAQIWYYNTLHTRGACLGVCLGGLASNYHDEDGSPNACIQCDEDESGPVFKAVSGRTRRNSGLPSALCRPCNTVSRVIHRYPPE